MGLRPASRALALSGPVADGRRGLGVAGPNWMLIGDAAACVNPLNGEGIDYGLETGRLAAEMLGAGDLTSAWPDVLRCALRPRRSRVARRLALLLTIPRFLPADAARVAMRSTVPDEASRCG